MKARFFLAICAALTASAMMQTCHSENLKNDFQRRYEEERQQDNAATETARVLLKSANYPRADLLVKLEAQARIFENAGHHAAALLIYKRVAEISEKLNGAESLKYAHALDDVVAAYEKIFDYQKAVEVSLRSLKIRELRCPIKSPELIDANLNVAEIYSRLSEFTKARPYLERAGALTAPVLKVEYDHAPSRPTDYSNAGLIQQADSLSMTGKLDQAELLYKRILAADFAMNSQSEITRLDLNSYIKFLKNRGETAKSDVLSYLVCNEKIYSKADFKPYILAKPNPVDLIYHPILNTLAGHGLEGKKLPQEIFRKLTGRKPPINMLFSKIGELFTLVESDAVKQFCAVCQGKTKAEIERFAGAPLVRGGLSQYKKFSPGGEEVWLYRLGYRELLARLLFQKNVCVSAVACTFEEDSAFSDWYASLICKWSKRKSINTIIARFGEPSASNGLNERVEPLANTVFVKLDYSVGPSTTADLTIKRGVCTQAGVGMLGH